MLATWPSQDDLVFLYTAIPPRSSKWTASWKVLLA